MSPGDVTKTGDGPGAYTRIRTMNKILKRTRGRNQRHSLNAAMRTAKTIKKHKNSIKINPRGHITGHIKYNTPKKTVTKRGTTPHIRGTQGAGRRRKTDGTDNSGGQTW